MEDQDLRDEFEAEFDRMRKHSVLSPAYRRKRYIAWAVRTAIAAMLYYFLWEYRWVRWTLLFYIPINLIGLLSIVGWSYLLNQKAGRPGMHIDRTGQDTEDIEDIEDIDYEEVD
jgi:hypothetical protein